MKSKNSKARMQVIFGALLFTLVFMIEMYGMLNYPGMFAFLAVIAVVDLIFLFIVIDGLMDLADEKKARQEEQYDSVFKSEKASYLMLKKYFEEIEDKLDNLEQEAKVPTEEIINAQKGIAKVIINRNHENMEALMNAYEQLSEEMGHFKEQLASVADAAKEYKEELSVSQKDSVKETEQIIQIKIQDLTVALKDMELRLNSAVMQSQKIIAQAPVMTAPMPQYIPSPQAVVPAVEPVENISEPEATTAPEEKVVKPETIPEPIEEPAAQEEPETVEVVEEEKPPMQDLSDPNRTMSPDEIAALFANMGGGSEPAQAEEKEEQEIVPEPVEEPAAQEEPETVEIVEEEKPPMPDLSDPNRTMSPDEIAALFANMGA